MRFNTFNQIHKALRAMLYDTSLTLQQTNFLDEQETTIAIEKVKFAVDMFDHHAHTEDHYILPAIQAYEPSVVATFEAEHVWDLKLSEQLKDAIYALELAAKAKVEMGTELTKAFVAFMTFNLNHMAKEEDVINKILWRYYSDAEILAINQKIVSELEPWVMQASAKWMLRGMNNTEIAGWLKAVRQSAPEPVFQSLFTAAEKELAPERFGAVVEGITDGVMIA
jgi:hemerythrin-like domain-containing protein